LYQFVEKVIGENLAPKITGMLIDLPQEEIKLFIANYQKFEEFIKEAIQVL
jgi:HSP90 family molecular chaperone